MSLVSTFRWNCNLLPKFGKTQSHLINCVLFICSFFNSFQIQLIEFSFFTYSIVKFHVALFRVLVGLDGLEPSTSRLSGARSSHLSYRPVSLRLFSSSIFSQGFTLDGGDEGIRTLDPLLAGQVLSQLSYTPIKKWRVKSEKWKVFASLFSYFGFVSQDSNWILTIEQQSQ